MNQKFREQSRHPLGTPLPVMVYYRNQKSNDVKSVEAMLLDVSEEGLGILVMEQVPLASRCSVELYDDENARYVEGDCCYLTETEYGLRLGVKLDKEARGDVLDYLDSLQTQLK
ncbi:PilZ domain-containing protein [Gallaecimonas kandeliae]|uniref:PilZ domain-containing protein n=1 Tax=Gallaecimonas kandeliae TaxID=3029055 RepID=UPI002647DAF0|nr:PilZ domain-containing protein [Gallaecimonas kandeliae]WKE64588.1 PilZ domain-containing protein [Gallaecimonas kandeliae]